MGGREKIISDKGRGDWIFNGGGVEDTSAPLKTKN